MNQPVKYILGLLVPIIAVLCLLSFGNSQWGKYTYVWQAKVYPRYPGKQVPVPDNYTGRWKGWDLSGYMFFEEDYVDGVQHGIQRTYHENGQLLRDENYKHGECDGSQRQYYVDGTLQYEYFIHEDTYDGMRKSFFSNGKFESIELFDKGVRLRMIDYYESGKVAKETVYYDKTVRRVMALVMYPAPDYLSFEYLETGELGKIELQDFRGPRTLYGERTLDKEAEFVDFRSSYKEKIDSAKELLTAFEEAR